MSGLQISTSGIIREVDANIEGYVYKVRKIGAGDELDIQHKASKIAAISKKAFNLKSKAAALEKSPNDAELAAEVTEQIGAIMDEIAMARGELSKCYTKLFDDGTTNQEYTKKLLEKYGSEGLSELNRRVFEAAGDKDA